MSDLNTNDLSQVSGGEGSGRVCELCGNKGTLEKYYITLKFTDGSEYLGLKRMCLTCRDTRLSAFIRNNYPDRNSTGYHLDGPV